MRWLLFVLVACSPNPRTQPKEAVAKAGEAGAVVAGSGAGSGSTPTPDAGRSKEVQQALDTLSSEHPEEEVPPVAWWKAHAADVRPVLRSWLADGTDDGNADLWAIRLLGDIGDPEDVELLATVLTTFKTDSARVKAANALGVHPAAAASDALVAATKLADVDTASYAASGLGLRKGDAAARKRLEELLDHEQTTMRYRAVGALKDLGGSEDALKRRRKIEKDADVKKAIDEALKK